MNTRNRPKVNPIMSPNKDNILGISIPGTSKPKVLKQVRDLVSGRSNKAKNAAAALITTPNPEILLLTHSKEKYRSIIGSSSLKIPDGIGLAVGRRLCEVNFVSFLATKLTRLLYLPLLYLSVVFARDRLTRDFEIIHGRKIFLDIIALAEENNWRVYLFGSRGSVIENTIENLSKKHKNLKIKGAAAPEYIKTAKPKTNQDREKELGIVKEINSYKPDILFVGIEPPKQEYWYEKNKSKLNSKVVMCVGGTFDYVAGAKNVPPEWIEKRQLEWFWRFLTEWSRPNHIKRIIRASIIFPLTVVFSD